MTFKADCYSNASTIQDLLTLAFHYLEDDEPSIKLNWDDDTESGFYEIDLFFNFTTVLRRSKLDIVFSMLDKLNLLAVEKPVEKSDD